MSVFIGLDPGEKTGFAVWDSDAGRFLEIATLELWKAMEKVNAWQTICAEDGKPLRVVFEDARQRTWFQRERNASEYRGKLMGAGAAKRDARIWEETLTAWGVPFEARKPAAGQTKWAADYWAKITGWTGRTSEHARDAALLVFQRK